MKKITLLWKTVLVAVGLFLGLQTSFAQGVFTSAATGNWNTAGSWTLTSGSDADGMPDADDNVTIVSTHIITVSASTTVECNNLTVAGANATSLTMAGANSIVNIYGTLAATTPPTAGNYIDCTSDATAKAVFKRNTTGPIISATGWGTFGEKVRIEVNVGAGIEAQVTPTIKFREIIVSSGTLTCSGVVSPDEGTANTGKVTIQDGAVFKCVQLKRTNNNVPFHSLTINGTGRLIFTGTSATSTPTVQSGFPIYTFSNDAVIEYQGLTSKIADIAFPNLVINAGGAPGTSDATPKTWEPAAATTAKSITVTRGVLTLTTSTITVNGDITVNSIGGITSGVTLNVSAGAKVTNNGTITNNGSFNFLSDATNGTATFIGNAISGGAVNVNQLLPNTRNYYISSPITAATAQSGYTWYERNEVASTWPSVSTGAPLTAGKGYIALPGAAASTITFTGTLNTGNVTVALTKSGSGFNLIGNPYPSSLKWENAFVVDVTNAALIEPSIYVRTNAGTANNSGQWSFLTYNASTGLTVPSHSLLSGGIIPPMQAFWVKAKAAGNLILDNKLTRMHQASNPLKAPALKNTDRQLVRLEVSNGEKTDETLIFSDANALDSYDSFDTPKFASTTPDIELFTSVGNEKLVMNGMNVFPINTPIGLGFVAGNASSFSIKANEITNIPEGVNVMLRDNVTLAETDLTDGTASYQFTPQTSSGDRFSLIFRAAGTTTSVNNISKLKAHVYVNAANQLVINAVEKTTYSIYNAVGMLIMNGQTTAKLQTVNYKLNTGVYVVELSENGQREIKKVIIR